VEEMSSMEKKKASGRPNYWASEEGYNRAARAWKKEAKMQQAITDAERAVGKDEKVAHGGGGGHDSFSGSATVGLAGLFKLIKRTVKAETPIRSYLISRAVYRIQAVKGYCKMSVRYEVRVLSDEWLTIPLLSNKVALTTSSVNISTATTAPFAIPPPVAPQPLSAELKRQDSSSSQKSAQLSSAASEQGEPRVELEAVNYNDAFATIAMTEGHDPKHCLMTNHKGEYIVELELLAAYTSAREVGMTIAIPEAGQNELTFEIPGNNLDIKVDPCLSTVKTINDGDHGSKSTSLVCQVPPTQNISIQWTEKIVVEEKLEVKVVKVPLPLTVTVEQRTLHSIGEGMLTSACSYCYKILNGSISALEIQIDPRVRILNVNGRAIKRYDVVEGSTDKKSGRDTGLDHKHGKKDSLRILKVFLDYGIEENYDVTIYSELDMGGTSSKVYVPVFRNLGVVSREKGFLGIEARTNVEVEFLEGDGIQPVDTSELPPQIWEAAGQPVILGYKFLDPSISVHLEVKKHADVGVLIAVIEDAHIVMTQTAEGRLLTKVALLVRNTQKQFLRSKRLLKPTFGRQLWRESQ